MMKIIIYLLVVLMAFTSVAAEAVTKKKSKKKVKKTTQTISPYVIAIGYPTTVAAYDAIKTNKNATIKPNAKPFGWQERAGPWYVATEQTNLKGKPKFEWAFTEAGHYAHPSVVKRMIDIGSTNHVYVDMAFRCGAANKLDCDNLLIEFKETNELIKKVYQKKYIVSDDGQPAWDGVDSLD